jgi:hypothetical protein
MGIGEFLFGKPPLIFESGGKWHGKGKPVRECCKNCGRHKDNHRKEVICADCYQWFCKIKRK